MREGNFVLMAYLLVVAGAVGWLYGRHSQRKESEAWELKRRVMDLELKQMPKSSVEVPPIPVKVVEG